MGPTSTFLDETNRATLRAVLNRVIPPNDALPGAGDLVRSTLESDVASVPTLRRAFLDGLRRLNLAAWASQDRSFADLDPAPQDALLRQAELDDAAFFDLLVRQTYVAYYADPRVVAALGQLPSPQPRGYTLPPFDPSLLDRVRERGRIWRKPE